MSNLHRRTFLKYSAAAAATGFASCLTRSAWAQPAGANDAVRVAVIGLNSKGARHVLQLLETPGVRVTALCDVDPAILAREVEKLKSQQIDAFATTDARMVFDRSDVDAVLIATGNHWHALLTVWACQAGKDVYVEKPASRTVWEGRRMVEAARKYGRIVQLGTQYRSDTGLPEAIAYLQDGHLGQVQAIHAVCYKLRESIGRRRPWYPDGLDYDLFCGPSPMVPLERNELHYDWHWMWGTGNGDMANLGVHVLDIARRFGLEDALPRRILSVGGRFARDDAGETPNTQFTVFDYPGLPVVWEGRGLSAKPGVNYLDNYRGLQTGVVVQCEGGYYAGYLGGAIYDRAGKQIRRIPGDGGRNHIGNFIEAVRSRRSQDLAAPIANGHRSTSLCHYGNISYRIGRPAAAAEVRQAIEAMPPALDTLDRVTGNLAAHGVDLERQRLTLGPWVQPDWGQDEVSRIEGGDEDSLEAARALISEAQRPPYVIPETV